MRILQILDRIDMAGGMQAVVLATSRRLAERGHDVTVLARSVDQKFAVAASPAVTVAVFDKPGAPSSIFASRARVASLSAAGTFDVFHSHFAYAALGASFAKRPQTARVRTYHGSWDLEGFAQEMAVTPQASRRPVLAAKRAARYAIEYADLHASAKIVALSDFSIGQLRARFGLSPAKIEKICGAVEIERFAPAEPKAAYRARLGLPSARELIFAAGRFERRKGFDKLIAAMPAVLAVRPEAMLAIAGGGPEDANLRAAVRAAGLAASVTFVGYLGNEITEYYRAADLFVLPSQALETFGLVTVEALASGTPVLGTPLAATPEILRPLDSRLVLESGSPRAIANGILDFFKGSWRERLSASFLTSYVRERYSWDAHANDLERIYAEALAPKKRVARA